MQELASAIEIARTWRPQRYGRRAGRAIEDPIVEPVWDGPRVLVAIEQGVATPFHDGAQLEGPKEVLDALALVAAAESLVVDGHLTEQALGSGEGVSIDIEEKSPSTASRLFGTAMTSRREQLSRERAEEAELARRTESVIAGKAGPVAFVATDLLWLDGESLLDIPLLERKRLLDSVLGESDLVRRSAYVRPTAKGSLMGWRALGFKSLAYKAANSRYRPGEPNEGWASVPISSVTRLPR